MTLIEALAVKSGVRGIGIGTKLLQFVKEKVSTFVLHVYKNNVHAVALYEKFGCKCIDEDINSYTLCYSTI